MAQEPKENINLPETPDPEKVPRDISLYQPVPVLRLTFKVTEEGYQLVSTDRILGAPSTAIVQDRPLRITAFGKQNEPLKTVSKPNPLEVRTAGTDRAGFARLDEATVTVFFDKPDQLGSVRIQLFENNEPVYEQTFEVQ
ncbi:hypothetical protein DDV96_13910 [Marixanthomonas spongiae]|uniref:Uncharacterized protein n=2 Tax=Marixanthomonas spongiae TaxID=2174845 RepID=A0A2U0HWI7_9FLAO|nr:hypothetical protein DDV96_13910 [Marixanthomonas spongiae]